MKEETAIEHIRELWAQSNDGDIIQAVQAGREDIEGYPPEIRSIVTEEAVKRGLIQVGASGEPVVTEKGRAIQYEINEDRPQTFLCKVITWSVGVVAGTTIIAVLREYGVQWLFVPGVCLIWLGLWWVLKIWKRKPPSGDSPPMDSAHAPAKEDIVRKRPLGKQPNNS